jgi:hypothetical protein
MLENVQGCSQKIGCPNKTVDIDDSKFGRRKYTRGHAVKVQWVFGGVERESGRTFLLPVPDRKADTLIAVRLRFTIWAIYVWLYHSHPLLTLRCVAVLLLPYPPMPPCFLLLPCASPPCPTIPTHSYLQHQLY